MNYKLGHMKYETSIYLPVPFKFPTVIIDPARSIHECIVYWHVILITINYRMSNSSQSYLKSRVDFHFS